MTMTTEKPKCADCGEYNASFRKSIYCSNCRGDHPHDFVKPDKQLRELRMLLGQNNCHCDIHLHAECTDECPSNRCYRVAAPVNSCKLCVQFHGEGAQS